MATTGMIKRTKKSDLEIQYPLKITITVEHMKSTKSTTVIYPNKKQTESLLVNDYHNYTITQKGTDTFFTIFEKDVAPKERVAKQEVEVSQRSAPLTKEPLKTRKGSDLFTDSKVQADFSLRTIAEKILTTWAGTFVSSPNNSKSILVSVCSYMQVPFSLVVSDPTDCSLRTIQVTLASLVFNVKTKNTPLIAEAQRVVACYVLGMILEKAVLIDSSTLVSLLLLEAGDVELNPGPVSNRGAYKTLFNIFPTVLGVSNYIVWNSVPTNVRVLNFSGSISSVQENPLAITDTDLRYALYRSNTGPVSIVGDAPVDDGFAFVGTFLHPSSTTSPNGLSTTITETEIILPPGYSLYLSASNSSLIGPTGSSFNLRLRYDEILISPAVASFISFEYALIFGYYFPDFVPKIVTAPFNVNGTSFTHMSVETESTSQDRNNLMILVISTSVVIDLTSQTDIKNYGAYFLPSDVGNKSTILPLPDTSTTMYVILAPLGFDVVTGNIRLKLLRSGDIEMNPGPGSCMLRKRNIETYSCTMLDSNGNSLTTSDFNGVDEGTGYLANFDDQTCDDVTLDRKMENTSVSNLNVFMDREYPFMEVVSSRKKRFQKYDATILAARISIAYIKEILPLSAFASANTFDNLVDTVGVFDSEELSSEDESDNRIREREERGSQGKKTQRERSSAQTKQSGGQNMKRDGSDKDESVKQRVKKKFSEKEVEKKDPAVGVKAEKKKKANQLQNVVNRIGLKLRTVAEENFTIKGVPNLLGCDKKAASLIVYALGLKQANLLFLSLLAIELKVQLSDVKLMFDVLLTDSEANYIDADVALMFRLFASLKEHTDEELIEKVKTAVMCNPDSRMYSLIINVDDDNTEYLAALAASANKRAHALNGNTSTTATPTGLTKTFPASMNDIETSRTTEAMLAESNVKTGPDSSTWNLMLGFSNFTSTRSSYSQNLNNTQYRLYNVQSAAGVTQHIMQFPISLLYPRTYRAGAGTLLSPLLFGRPLTVGAEDMRELGYEIKPTNIRKDVIKNAGSAASSLGRTNNIQTGGFPSTLLMSTMSWAPTPICMDLPALKMVQLLHVLEWTPDNAATWSKTHEAALADPWTRPSNNSTANALLFTNGSVVFNENSSGGVGNTVVDPYGRETVVKFHVGDPTIDTSSGERWIAVPPSISTLFPTPNEGLGVLLLAMCFAPKSYISTTFIDTSDDAGNNVQSQSFATYADCVYLPGEGLINMVFPKSGGYPVPFDQATANSGLYSLPTTGPTPFTVGGVVVPAFSRLNMSFDNTVGVTTVGPTFNVGAIQLTMARWIYSWKDVITPSRIRQFINKLAIITPMNNSLLRASYTAAWLFTSIRRPTATIRTTFPPIINPALLSQYQSVMPNGYGRSIQTAAFPIDISTYPREFVVPQCSPHAFSLVVLGLYYPSTTKGFDTPAVAMTTEITTFRPIFPIQLRDSQMLYFTCYEALKIASTYSMVWGKMGYPSADILNSLTQTSNSALMVWSENLRVAEAEGGYSSTQFNYEIKAMYCSLWKCAFPSLIDLGTESWFGDCFTYPQYFVGGVDTTNVGGGAVSAYVPQLISDAFIQLTADSVPKMLKSWSSLYTTHQDAARYLISHENNPSTSNMIINDALGVQHVMNLDSDMVNNVSHYPSSDIFWQDDSTIWNMRMIIASINTSIIFRDYTANIFPTVPSNTLVYPPINRTGYYPFLPFGEASSAMLLVYPRVRLQVQPVFISHQLNGVSGITMVQALQGSSMLSPPAIIAGSVVVSSVDQAGARVNASSMRIGTGIRSAKRVEPDSKNTESEATFRFSDIEEQGKG